MRRVNVEIAEDASRAEGGFAIVLMHGVQSLPDNVRFRIKPVEARDQDDAGAGQDWPKGEHRPVAVRSTDLGIELVIGPEIVECPALIAGTVGVIEIPAAGLRGEFLWPSIRPTARPRRKHLSLIRPPRNALPPAAAVPAADPQTAPPPARPVAAQGAAEAAPPPVRVEKTAEKGLAELRRRPVADAAVEAAPPAPTGQAVEPAPPAPVVPEAEPDAGWRMFSPASVEASDPAGAAAIPDQTDTSTPPPLPPAADEPASDSAASSAASLESEIERLFPRERAERSDASTASKTAAPAAAAALPPIDPFEATIQQPSPRGAGRKLALIAASLAVVVGAGYLLTHAGTPAVDNASAGARPASVPVDRKAATVRVAGQAEKGDADKTGSQAKSQPATAEATRQPQPALIDERYLEGVPRMARSDVPGSSSAAAPGQQVAALEPPLAVTGNTHSAGIEPASPRSPAAGAPASLPSAGASATSSDVSQASPEVTLRIRGGGFQITGELKGYDGLKYLIDTRTAGLMTMDATRFECVGEACTRKPAPILPPTERPSPIKPETLVIEGSPTLGESFIPKLVRAYAASIGAKVAEQAASGDKGRQFKLTDSRGAELVGIEVRTATSQSALAALDQGSAALALVERPIGIEEEGRGTRRVPVTEHPIALDGIAVVASPKSPVAAASVETLAKLVSGQISDWAELGFAPAPVQLYLPAESTGTLDTFSRLVLKPRNLKPAAHATTLPSDAQVADAVSRDPGGIGLVSFAAVRSAKPLNLETHCGLITRPNAFGVKTEEYPLARRLLLVAPQQSALASVRGIVRIAQSDGPQAVLEANLIDQSISLLSLADQSERMAWAFNAPAAAFDMSEMRQMLNDLAGSSRLSLPLRFNSNNDLDQRSRRDLVRLAAALKEPDLAGRRVILAGFTDSQGKFQPNLTVGAKRASQVRTALLQAAGSALEPRLVVAKGYGPLAPVACAQSADGQRLNRRVEVWVSSETPAKTTAR